jgi:hypothetical protein
MNGSPLHLDFSENPRIVLADSCESHPKTIADEISRSSHVPIPPSSKIIIDCDFGIRFRSHRNSVFFAHDPIGYSSDARGIEEFD